MPQLAMLGALAGPLIGGISDVLGLGATAATAAAPAAAGLGTDLGLTGLSFATLPGVASIPSFFGGVGSALGGLGASLGDLTQYATLPGGTAASFFGPSAADLSSAVSGVPFATLPGGTAPSFFAPSAAGVESAIGNPLSYATLPGGAQPSFFAPGAAALPSVGLPGIQGALPTSAASTLASIPTTGLDLGIAGAQPATSAPAGLPGSSASAAAPLAPSTGPVQAPPQTTAAPAQQGAPTSAPGVLGDISGFLNRNRGLLQLLTEGAGIAGAAGMRPKIPGVGQNLSGLNPQSAIGQQAGAGAVAAGLVQPQVTAAQNLTSQSQPLISAPTTGQLPPGMQTLINQALQDTQTQIRSQYANRGMSGSSAEQQDLEAAQERAASATASLLLQTGQTGIGYQQAANQTVSAALSAAGLQDQVFQQIAGIQLGEDTALQQALAQLASASAMGSGLAVGAGGAAQ